MLSNEQKETAQTKCVYGVTDAMVACAYARPQRGGGRRSGGAVAVFNADVMHMCVVIHLSCCVQAHLEVEKDAGSRESFVYTCGLTKKETVQIKCV